MTKPVEAGATGWQPEYGLDLAPVQAGEYGAIALWREKLAFMLNELPKQVDPQMRFSTLKCIEECMQNVNKLAGFTPQRALNLDEIGK
jgi:hypothetical protein